MPMSALQIDTFCHYSFLSQVKIAPNGHLAAFLVKEANLDQNNYDSHIWLYDLVAGRLRQLTTAGTEQTFAWLEDSEQILFVSRRDADEDGDKEESTIYRIAVTGGEAQLAFRVPYRIESFRPVDDKRLLFAAMEDLNRVAPPSEESHADYLARQAWEAEQKDYHVLDELPYWSNGAGYTNKKRRHLFLYDLEAQQVEPLTPGPLQVQAYDLMGEQVILTGQAFTDQAPITNTLYPTPPGRPHPQPGQR